MHPEGAVTGLAALSGPHTAPGMVHARTNVQGLVALQSSRHPHRGASLRDVSGRASKWPATAHSAASAAQAPETIRSATFSAASSCDPTVQGGAVTPAATVAAAAGASGPASTASAAVAPTPDWGPRRVVAVDIEYIALEPRSGDGRMYQLPGEVAVVDISGRVLFQSFCHPGFPPPPPPPPGRYGTHLICACTGAQLHTIELLSTVYAAGPQTATHCRAQLRIQKPCKTLLTATRPAPKQFVLGALVSMMLLEHNGVRRM